MVKKQRENSENTVDSYIKTSVKIAKNISDNLQEDLSPVLEPIEDYMKHYIDMFIQNIFPQNLDKSHQKYKYLISGEPKDYWREGQRVNKLSNTDPPSP